MIAIGVAVLVLLGYYYLQAYLLTGQTGDADTSEDAVPVLTDQNGAEIVEVSNLDEPVESKQDVQEALTEIDNVNVDYLDAALQATDQEIAEF